MPKSIINAVVQIDQPGAGVEVWRCDYCDEGFDAIEEAHEHEYHCKYNFDPDLNPLSTKAHEAIELDNLDLSGDDLNEGEQQSSPYKGFISAFLLVCCGSFMLLMILSMSGASVVGGGGGVAGGGAFLAVKIVTVIQNVEMQMTFEAFHLATAALDSSYCLSLAICRQGPGANYIYEDGASVSSVASSARRTGDSASRGLWITFEAQLDTNKLSIPDFNVTTAATGISVTTLVANMALTAQAYGVESSMPSSGSIFLGQVTVTAVEEGAPTPAPTTPPTFAPDITRAPTPPTSAPTPYPTQVPTPSPTPGQARPIAAPTSAPTVIASTLLLQ